jgi:hypothetical protein
MLSVCEGRRFARLGDGRGFMEKLKNFISIIDFFLIDGSTF